MCNPSSGHHPAYDICTSMKFDILAMMETSHAIHQVDTDISEPGNIYLGDAGHWLQLVTPQL
jgi:hypothetical protein